MKQITLGQNGPKTSRLIYGVMRVVNTWQPNLVTEPVRVEAVRMIQSAYEAGYTHFDNADIYCHGECERVFGRALQETPGMRDQIIITTKCGVRFADDPPGWPKRFDQTGEHIIDSCERSLERMGIETIDVYLLHRPDWLMPAEEVADAFEKLHRSGKVRYFGVSNFSTAQLDMLRQTSKQPIITNQICIHPGLADFWESGQTLWELAARGITPTAWSPVWRGLFAENGKPDPKDPDRERHERIIAALDEIAEREGRSRTVITLAWLMLHPAGILPIIGSTQPDRIRDAATADDYEMSRADWYRVLRAVRGRDVP